MADALWLISRTSQGVSEDRNRVREILINIDDGDDDATKIQGAVDALNVAHPTDGEPVYPAGYFDTVLNIDDLAGTGETNLRTEFDFIAFGPEVKSVRTLLV